MKISEIKKQGMQFLNDVFCAVLKSDDKELWLDALDRLKHISDTALIKAKVDPFGADFNKNMINARVKANAYIQLHKLFGNKFIKC